jgi:hypothetical protein
MAHHLFPKYAQQDRLTILATIVICSSPKVDSKAKMKKIASVL